MIDPLNYANESYTRIYNRLTPEDKAVGADARGVLWHIRCLMDQAGIFRFGRQDMTRYVAAETGYSRERIEDCLPLLIQEGLLHVGDGFLIDPEYVESQTASKSNKLRQREFRDRQRTHALDSVRPSQQDLPGIASDQEPSDSSNRSLRVTDVTHGKAEASVGGSTSSSLSDPKEEVNNSPPTRARVSEPPNHSPPPPLPDSVDSAPPAPAEPPALRLVKSDPPPALPRVVAPPAGYNHQDMIRDFSRLRKAKGGGAQAYQHSLYDCSQAVLAWAVEECPIDPKAAILKSIENYLLDDWARTTGWPYKFWAGDPGKWHAAKPGSMRSKRAGNPAPVSTREEFELAALNNPSWGTEALP